jgi:hypothetical protein
MSDKTLDPKLYVVDAASGIRIPAHVAKNLVDVKSIVPNKWNPNSMESFMRSKLVKGIQTDGFVYPVLVRPYTGIEEDADWEIVDGEHRWRVATDELGMSKIPIINLGPISDAQAKELMIKANALRGEFDSVKLANVVKELVDTYGKGNVVDSLPYQPERVDALLAMTATDLNTLLPLAGGSPTPPPTTAAPTDPAGEFKTLDPAGFTADCKCPRCGFEFNNKKAA